ncbi:hypothetical protein Tco_0289755 [Tanacetum coccineum]
MVGCCFHNVKKVEESVALKELRLNTLRFMQRLICRDWEKGGNHSRLCVLAMKAWLGLGRHGGTEKDMKVSTRAAIRVVKRVVGDCVNGEGWKNDFATSAVQMQKQVKMQVALGDKSSSSSINFGSSSLIAKVHRGALVMSKR